MVSNNTTMVKRRAASVGFLVAAAIPPLLSSLFGLILNAQSQKTNFAESLLGATVFFVVLYPYSILFAAVFGLPIFLLANRFGIVTWWLSVIVGMLVGVAAFAITEYGNQFNLKEAFEFACAGMSAGFVFWKIWQRGK